MKHKTDLSKIKNDAHFPIRIASGDNDRRHTLIERWFSIASNIYKSFKMYKT